MVASAVELRMLILETSAAFDGLVQSRARPPPQARLPRGDAVTHWREDKLGLGLLRWLSVFFAPELRAWRGEMALWKVYWGYGVFASALFAVLIFEAFREQRLWPQQGLLLAFLLYTVWILISVWRCAERAKPYWRLFARLSTVAWAGNTLMVLGFLELELLARLFAP